MAQDLLVIEEVDVRRADEVGDNRVITLTKMVLPPVKRKRAEHTPGGGIGTVAHNLPMIDALEPTFSSKGLDFDIMQTLGMTAGLKDKWTFAATVRNKRTHELLPLRATIQGIVSDWTPGDHTPGELLDCDYAITEVTFYSVYINGKRYIEWDHYARDWWAGDVNIFAEYKNNLGA